MQLMLICFWTKDEIINYLSEMMNFPGVLHHNEEAEAKLIQQKNSMTSLLMDYATRS